jgi:transcriptional regulator GlxA family with amidase domain
MIHISILVPEGECSLANIEGTYQIFSKANEYLAKSGKPSLFRVQLVGLHRDVSINNGRFSIHPDVLIKEVHRTDLIIIPAVFGDFRKILAANQDMLSWIVERYKEGASVASLCIGAFILAGTGLLNGRTCTTHWEFSNDFRKMFPTVNLLDDKVITHEEGIYTSGGAYSWLNLILYLIEKYAGRDIAILCSKAFQIDIDRNSQSPFIIFSGQRKHEDKDIIKAQDFIEKNVHSKILIHEIATMLSIGRRNLERRFKSATGNTVMKYIQRVKIEAVKQNLESSRLSVNEAMNKVGYSDPKAFRIVFKKVTGLAPLQYRSKYHRQDQG